MADFEHKDPDGDTLQVDAMKYPNGLDAPGWLLRVIPGDGREHRSVWLPAAIATKLAALLAGERINRTRISVGAGAVESLQHVAEVASIKWQIGDHKIEIEGRTAGEVADALRVALGDSSDTTLLVEVAELLDCDPSELLGDVRAMIERLAEMEAERTEQAGTVASMQHAIDDLRLRPTTAQLQQAERAAKDADRRATRHAADLKALQATVEADHNGIAELRRELLAAGLQGMSTAPLPEVAAAIARLGAENNRLREGDSRGGMADELQRMAREQREEIDALQQINEQLQAAIERERELRKAAEAGRDEWIKRSRSETERAALLQEQLLTATAEAKLQATAAQRYLDMLRTAREALHEVVGEFVNADTEEIEAADLSSEQAAMIVARIRQALAATA